MSRSRTGLWIPTVLVAVALIGLGSWTLHQQQRLLSAQLQNGGFERSVAVQGLFEQLRMESLSSKASALAENQAFVAYVVQALNLGALPDSATDISSVSDLLGERAEQLGFAVTAVIDDSGRVMTSSDAAVPRGQKVGNDTLLDRIVDNDQAEATVIDAGNGPLLAAIAPMQRGGLFDGFLLAGLRLDGAMMEDLAQAAAAEVSLLQLNRGEVTLRYSNAPPALQLQLPQLVGNDWSGYQGEAITLQADTDTLRLNRLFGAEQLLLAYHLPAEAVTPALEAVSRPLLIAYLGCALLLALWLWWLRRQRLA